MQNPKCPFQISPFATKHFPDGNRTLCGTQVGLQGWQEQGTQEAGSEPLVRVGGAHKDTDSVETKWLALWVYHQEDWGWALWPTASQRGTFRPHVTLCAWPGLTCAWTAEQTRRAVLGRSPLQLPSDRHKGQRLSHCLLQAGKATGESFIGVWVLRAVDQASEE